MKKAVVDVQKWPFLDAEHEIYTVTVFAACDTKDEIDEFSEEIWSLGGLYSVKDANWLDFERYRVYGEFTVKGHELAQILYKLEKRGYGAGKQ